MSRWQGAWTSAELESAYLDLANAAITLRAMREYGLSSLVKRQRDAINDELNRRARELEQYTARQLTLVNPGAYGETPSA
jgi:hypothetical protein